MGNNIEYVDSIDKETSDLADWLSESLTHSAFSRFLVLNLQSKLSHDYGCNKVISDLFDNDCNFQEFISKISYDIAENIAIAAVKSKHDDK